MEDINTVSIPRTISADVASRKHVSFEDFDNTPTKVDNVPSMLELVNGAK